MSCDIFGNTDVCLKTSALLGVQGSGAGTVYNPSSITCFPQPVCQTIQITYQVPAGVYSQQTLTWSLFGQQLQWMEADDPQVQVGNNTTVSLALDNATQVTVNTPNPAARWANFLESDRTLPNGTQLDTGLDAPEGVPEWAIPTQPVTVGGYLFKTAWTLIQPQIALSTHPPQAVQLHPYPFAVGQDFQGKQTLQVVDGGFGNPSDFASIDARGKLVLIRNEPDAAHKCAIWQDKIQNAANAGAVGVLYDSTQPIFAGGACELPMFPAFPGPPNQLPYAELTASDAQLVRTRLAQGPVSITVTGTPAPSPYVYDLTFIDRGSVPASEAHTVTAKDLAAANGNFHSPQPAQFSPFWLNLASDEIVTGGINEFAPIGPLHVKYFIGPVSPELLWIREVQANTPDGSQVLGQDQIETVYNTAGLAGAEDWFAQPTAPGVPVFPSALLQAQPSRGAFAICSGCRQGNDFIPWMYMTSPDPVMTSLDPSENFPGIDPSTVHLYQGSQEILPTPNPFGLSEYTLPSQQASYRLILDDANTHTTWDFASAEPTTDQTPPGYICVSQGFGITGPCQAAPLIFLRYDAGVSLSDTVTAPGSHQIKITAIHLDPSAPAITSLNVWTSTDGGQSWVPASASGQQHDGTFTATYSVPQVSATDGSVSLKVQATDADGNDTTQVITDAFSLTP